MKNSKIFLCFSLMFLVFLSITNVNAADNVKIKSVELVDKSINAAETSKATSNGLIMNFNIRFLSVDDYAKYKVVVENKENKDYEISVDSEFNTSKYITYEYEKANNIKANSDTEFYVTVSYKNEVSEDSFSDGKYSEKNSAVLKLDDGSVSNPITSNNEAILIIGLLIITVGLFVLFKSKTNKNISFIVLVIFLLMPLFVKAIDSLKITVNSNIMIEKKYFVAYSIGGFFKASESDNYDLTKAKYCSDVYVDSVSDENKYTYCEEGVFYKGDKLYAPGETVNFDPDSFESYSFELSDCQESEDDEDVYICGAPKKAESINYFYYNAWDMKYFGYKYNEDDNVVMKFSNARDRWENQGEIYVYRGSTFTMPNHNVLFTGVPD